jgi:hypothetical protein
MWYPFIFNQAAGIGATYPVKGVLPHFASLLEL